MEQRLIDANALYTAMKQEWMDDNGIVDVLCVIDAMPTVDAVPVCELKEILMRYFDIGDSYHYELTRVKDAFQVGTMSFDDFQEWTEENVYDLVLYIKKNCTDSERKDNAE